MTAVQRRRPCPVCGASAVRRRFREDGASIGRCRGCGTLYTYEPCTESPAAYFKDEYIQGDDHLEKMFGSYRADAFVELGSLLTQLTSGGRILDIGCASGEFLASLDPAQWERVGVEPSVLAVRRARERGLQVVEGVFGSVSVPFDRFDAITMLDMLPLVEDPRAVFRSVASLLDPNGLLIVETPGSTSRLLKNTGPLSFVLSRRWSRLNPRDFVFFPSTTSIRRLLADAGLELVSINDVRPNRYGSARRQRALGLYYHFARAVGRVSGQRLMLATKILYVARRPTANAV